ncbi:MAG TPA: thioredoxin family protein [Anaerolineales bacterium]|nr:thioredoxin family protein [Anaerolineales bacterium]
MKTIPVTILGYKQSQRYPIWRALTQAQTVFEKEHMEYRLAVQEVTSTEEILHFTPVIAFPSLMIAGKLVCVGRSPAKHEILAWLESEVRHA